ncbi:MAG TPA: HAMP domain-containing sensor histidine kinase [Longimicrobium sp.]|jgi:signal transduction histidine kinase|uniref:sensor histidine kinase n=1 Tax=Longimicrobium sp. TaxID=2029185 RepID=UPI002ED9431C
MSTRRALDRMARGPAATGALLALALLLSCAVAYQAYRAARAQRAATERLLRDHAAYAAAEFVRRAEATLHAGFITLNYSPTATVEGRPESTPLMDAAVYRRTVREQDTWCECLARAEGFFRMTMRDGSLQVAGAALDGATERWVRTEVDASVQRLVRSPRDASVNLYGSAEGRYGPSEYQMRIGQSVGRWRVIAGRTRTLLYTVAFDDADRPRAVYGLADDATAVTTPVFARVAGRVPLLPASVLRGVPNDSLLVVTVRGPGGVLFRTGRADRTAPAAEEPFTGEFAGLVARVELRPGAVGRLVEGGLPASPLPLLLGLLSLTAATVGIAFAQMRRQQELARLRADFVSGVSHELRTPLTQIRMFSELLLGGRLRTEEERGRSLRLIDREARRLSYLVENVLDFSRGARGTLAVAPRPVRVASAVAEIVEEFAPVAHARRMQVVTRGEADAVAALDRGGFRQILLNFLENAVKYGPPGQTVAVAVERAANAVRVSVRDSGPGLPAGERERIWEAYHRLDRDIDRVVGGSGIGLHVVRELVGRHGGRAWVQEAEGGGAHFTAEFPAVEVGAEEEAGSMAEGAGR